MPGMEDPAPGAAAGRIRSTSTSRRCRFNGKAPAGIQAFKRDSVNLGPGGTASMLIRFRSFPDGTSSTATTSSTRTCG